MASRRRSKTARRIALGVLGLVAVATAALAAALIVLHTDWGRDRVREQLEDQLAETFAGGGTIGKLEGSPLGELRARDVVIFGPDGGEAITAKTVRLRLALLPLLSKRARLSSAILEDVSVNLERDARGELELGRLLRPGPSSGWSAELPDVRVHRGRVAYDTGRGERLHLDDVELRAEARVPFARPLGAAVRLTARWRERALPIELDARLRSGEGELLIERLSARAGQVSVTGEDVRIARRPAGAPAIEGTVSLDAPRAAARRLGLGLEPPADLRVWIEAAREPASPWTRVELAGQLGAAPVNAWLRADLDARRVSGFVAAGALDAAALSGGRIEGSASTFASFDVALPAGRALPVGTAVVHAWGALERMPRTDVRVALSSTGERATARADLAGPDLRATVAAEVSRRGRAITLHRGTLAARTTDPRRASGGAAPVRGALRAELTASGALAPAPSLAVAGTIDGRRLRFRDLSIDAMKLAIDARGLPARPSGRAELLARGVVRGSMDLAELAVTAADRPDGRLAVAVRTRPKRAPWLLEADALVTPGDTVAIDLVRHRVRAGDGVDWRGTTGRIAIAPARIEVRDLATRSSAGALAIDGTYHRAGRRAGDVEARVAATTFALGTLDPRYRGAVSGRATLARRGRRVTGRAELTGRGVALDPASPPVDADARLAVDDRRLAVDASARGPRLGRVALAAEVDAPRDASNPRAWQALGREAIRAGRLTLQRVDLGRALALAGAPGEHRGMIDGELRLTPDTATGAVTVRALVTPATRELGPIDADLQLAQEYPSSSDGRSPRELAPSLTVRLGRRGAGLRGTDLRGTGLLGTIHARARLAIPARPFDPRAWRRLGRGAITSAVVRTSELAFDPELLARLGIASTLRGRASLSVELEEGARVARARVCVRELRGGAIAEPVSVELSAASGEQATTFRLVAGAAGVRLVEADGRIARTLAELRADPGAVRTAPLSARARLPDVPARRLLAVFGRGDVTGGSISGTLEVAGTVAAPTGRARVALANVTMPPDPAGRPAAAVDRLTLDAAWDGRTGTLAVSGVQPGGSLDVVAKGSPRMLGAATLTLRATRFDLRPLLAFVPGAASGSAGRLDARLSVIGLDPRTSRLAGELRVDEARIPIAPSVGTLRRAKIELVAGERDLWLRLDGRLGGGTVKATGTIALDGAAPTGGDLTLALRDVSPIGAVEPELSADVTAKLAKGRDRWIADVAVRNGAVRVPDGRGEALKPVGPPDDMVLVSGGAPGGRRARGRAPPSRPVIEARVRIDPTYLDSEELRGVIKGRLTITADADSIGLVGEITADRGDVELFGRRYLVERASARFDGPTDPLLDVVITHDFPEVTTITTVRGRLSDPELIMSSDPSVYSQGQLLGFLLGGEPNGQPETGNPRERVTATGTSLVANRLAGYIRRALPIDLDVLRYEAATASTGAAFTVGTWLTRSLFVAYRHRLAARPDENTNEAEAEYWITRRVMLEGVLGDRGVSGLDLLWRKRY